jgi:hypothetical protein
MAQAYSYCSKVWLPARTEFRKQLLNVEQAYVDRQICSRNCTSLYTWKRKLSHWPHSSVLSCWAESCTLSNHFIRCQTNNSLLTKHADRHLAVDYFCYDQHPSQFKIILLEYLQSAGRRHEVAKVNVWLSILGASDHACYSPKSKRNLMLKTDANNSHILQNYAL